ncbi:MAG: ABC transporter permease [Rhodospirillales bacterium]|nr:ABC transporter permease [Rhodospirillales bacterium]MDH3792903.1 ABC transporter permease [Rhodospirillales bacterium]MDH3911335.1 ABC transporter permease [Rhodospirillales bacterium]MDH3968237.1 ABC transporter permease [Rhodospirillales bacterium]
MTRYILQRLVESAVVLLIMSFVIYGLIGLMPGDPIDLMVSADPDLTPADAERLRALYGLDRPILERYLNWLGAALSGDIGYSRIHARPVMAVLLPALANTVWLMGLSFALALAIALPAGILAALRPRSAVDNAINLLAFAGISIPPFWLAILLIILFAVILGWLPAGGMGGGGLGSAIAHLALPVATLTLVTVGGIVRFVRAAMMEALRQDYVRTAQAKGLSARQVVLGHALRNAMIPVVTVLALNFGTLFSGALITETMFGWLGMGKTIYDAIMGNDFNLALVGLLFATLTTLLANLAADVTYAWLDPRISYK